MNDRDLIRLGLRTLGAAGRDGMLKRKLDDKFLRADLELMGIWRSAVAIGAYGALDDLELMQKTAWHIACDVLSEKI